MCVRRGPDSPPFRKDFTVVSKTNRSAVSNRSRLLEGVDGRTATARRFRDICRAYEVEIGGLVSEVERDLIRQAAGLTLRSEQMQAAIVRGEMVDNDQLIRISSTARRVLETISLKAAKRKSVPAVTLADHIAQRNKERALASAED
jgi:hypothetical protein